MADSSETVDNLPAEVDPLAEVDRLAAGVTRSRRPLVLSITGVLLFVAVLVVWAATGRDLGADTPSVGVLPLSDERAGPALARVAPPSTLKPLIEVEEPALEGELVATAKITRGEVEVWASPDEDEPAWRLPVPTEFWGDRHFLVVDEIDGWYKILVPVRPNETEGWIPAEAVTISATNFSVQISVSDRSLKVWEGDELIIDTTSAVGRDNAPTPLGNFYIRDVLAWDENSAYGPYVLALSAYSETIDMINGGDAVVAIHGTSRPELIGRAVSLGCIRLHNDDITLLAETVPVGTPVRIVG